MKKAFLILLLSFCTAGAYAQSVSLYQLINLSNLTNEQAYNFFMAGKVFKLLYTQSVKGLSIEYYQTNNSGKKEEIIIGDGVRSDDGTLLHTVRYSTTKPGDLLKMVAQAKGAGLSVNFEGSDATKNIYMFDNFLYTVHIYISIDDTNGLVEVQQKDFIDYE